MPGTAGERKRKRGANDTVAARAVPGRANEASSEPGRTDDSLGEGESVRERARPYLLAVAKMPLGVLSTAWSVGRNRRLDPGHVRDLKEAFRKMGPERCADEHRLRLLCGAEAVRRVASAHRHKSHRPDELASFLDWADFNDGTVEVMAGQHRIQALREYVKERGSPESELWWACELYDIDRLPRDLNIKLRVNRRDPNLPDNQGQIWMQLVSIASDAAGTLPEEQVKVDHKLVEALRIGGEKNFPTRKLVTLWNHKGWRDRTTRWCRTRLGLETFNISAFEWFSSLRIDEYWFATLDAILDTLEALPLDQGNDLGKEDWHQLAASLGARGRTAAVVEAAFYQDKNGRRTRRDGLLASLDSEAYDTVCRAISAAPELTFPNLKPKLRPRKQELPIMVRALQHVVGWIDTDSGVAIGAVNPKAKNKPLVREHLCTALGRLARSKCGGDFPADTAVCLQERVLDFVDSNMDQFRVADASAFLGQDLSLVDTASYAERFKHVAWAGLLRVVRQTTDTNALVLRPAWQTVLVTKRNGRRDQISTLVQTFCADIFKLANGPKFQGSEVQLAVQREIEQLIDAKVGILKGADTSGAGAPVTEAGLSGSRDTILSSDPGLASVSQFECNAQAAQSRRRALPEGRVVEGRTRPPRDMRDLGSRIDRDQSQESNEKTPVVDILNESDGHRLSSPYGSREVEEEEEERSPEIPARRFDALAAVRQRPETHKHAMPRPSGAFAKSSSKPEPPWMLLPKAGKGRSSSSSSKETTTLRSTRVVR